MNALARLVDERNVLVCVGTGGVGKTTTAAALAMAAARRGRRVCVLTIDPARRLAMGAASRAAVLPINGRPQAIASRPAILVASMSEGSRARSAAR